MRSLVAFNLRDWIDTHRDQLRPLFERFCASAEHRTCHKCGTIMPQPQ